MHPTNYSPAVLDPTNYSYRERDLRAPVLITRDHEGQTLVFDEPGRVLNNVCYRSHYLRVVKPEYGPYTLLVKHGAGTESWRMDYTKQTIDALASLDSDGRYLVLHTIMRAHQESRERTAEKVNATWRKAAAEKRIKTRKLPGQNAVKVWVEPEVIAPVNAALATV